MPEGHHDRVTDGGANGPPGGGLPGRSDHGSYSRRAAAIAPSNPTVGRFAVSARVRAASKALIRSARLGCRTCCASHCAVFSVGTPRSSARTCAACADGGQPADRPRARARPPKIAQTPAILVVFPVPAGPTSTSSTRPDVVTVTAAGA